MSATTVDRPVTTNGSDEVVRLPRRTIDKLLVAIGLVAAIVFAAAGAMLMWGSNFAEDYVHDSSPPRTSASSPTPAASPEEGDDLVKYAMSRPTPAPRPRLRPSIGGHLEGIADGEAYAEIDDRGAAQAVVDARESGASEAEIAEHPGRRHRSSRTARTRCSGARPCAACCSATPGPPSVPSPASPPTSPSPAPQSCWSWSSPA